MAEFETVPKYIAYGTAGFRDNAQFLPTVLYRVGLIAALRSRFLGGKTIGVMITASHNPPQDNGAKLIDPLGEMLDQSWEQYATDLVNTPSSNAAAAELDKLYSTLKVNRSSTARVVYARDTRESGPKLVAALRLALEADHVTASDAGLLTTPQLHYLVKAINTQNLPGPKSADVPTENGYYTKLGMAFRQTMALAHASDSPAYNVTVDCANGVGAPKLQQLATHISDLITFNIINDDTEHPAKLNENCGADYVKSNQKPPAHFSSAPERLAVSFDGDADRIVCYYLGTTGRFHLLDGDKIASLAGCVLRKLVAEAGIDAKLGIVQTAYANGASTEYIREDLKLPVACTPTGVKHLHHEALKFGIGIYFEANGHGTVLINSAVVDALETASETATSPEQKRAIEILLAFNDLINQTIGDAISDLLMIVAMLSFQQWGPSDWDASYTDLPNRLVKVNVADRTIFTTTDAERRLVTPAELQPKLDDLMQQYPKSRTFVRASGTEDVVRVYAEAATVGDMDELCDKVLLLVAQYS